MELRSIFAGKTYASLIEGSLTEVENRRLHRLLSEMRAPQFNIELIFEDDEDADPGNFGEGDPTPFLAYPDSHKDSNERNQNRKGWYCYQPTASQFENGLPEFYYFFEFNGEPTNPTFMYSELRVFWMSTLPPEKLTEVLAELRSEIDLNAASRDVDL